MNINVPFFARDHFWEEPPPGSEEFWSFRFPPPCKPGDPIAFRFDGSIVARATVDRIETPIRDGGSEDLNNLRTLCVPCHKAETAAFARTRSLRRRSAKDGR